MDNANALVALLDHEGNVMHNTVLCDHCAHFQYRLDEAKLYAIRTGEWDQRPFTDVSDRGGLACQVCKRSL